MTIIPNSFQHPNVYVDQLSYYLSGDEEKVLNKALREILGWHKRISERKAPISLSQFVEGKTDEEGNELAKGCGLGLHAVRTALEALDRYKILVKVGPPTQDGQIYWLQDDFKAIDWDGLAQRRAEQEAINKRRTEAARKKKAGRKRRPAAKKAAKPAPTPPQTEGDPIAIMLTAFCEQFGMPIPEAPGKVEDWCDSLDEIYRMAGRDLAISRTLIEGVAKALPKKYVVTGPGSIVEPCRVVLGQQTRDKQNERKGKNDGKKETTSADAYQQLANW